MQMVFVLVCGFILHSPFKLHTFHTFKRNHCMSPVASADICRGNEPNKMFVYSCCYLFVRMSVILSFTPPLPLFKYPHPSAIFAYYFNFPTAIPSVRMTLKIK